MPPDDRMTRGPLARSPDECSLDRSRSFLDPALEFRRKRTDLHSTGRGRRAARCPIERCVKRGKFQDCESAQLLLGIREGAILHASLSVLKSYGGASLRHLKWIAANVDAGLNKSLKVRPPRADIGIGVVVVP